jgi:hypothetical protein
MRRSRGRARGEGTGEAVGRTGSAGSAEAERQPLALVRWCGSVLLRSSGVAELLSCGALQNEQGDVVVEKGGGRVVLDEPRRCAEAEGCKQRGEVCGATADGRGWHYGLMIALMVCESENLGET